MTDKAIYGYCPKCGTGGQLRERRPNGDDICEKGCKYPTREALPEPKEKKTMPFSRPTPCTAVDHNAPTHLYVPPGGTYVHTCPACGKVSTISPPNITLLSL